MGAIKSLFSCALRRDRGPPIFPNIGDEKLMKAELVPVLIETIEFMYRMFNRYSSRIHTPGIF